MAGKRKTAEAEADTSKVQEGELAVRITKEGGISGGLGNHKEGAVLRHLSHSAFNTLTQGGLGDPLEAGADASDAVDASAPIPPTGDGGDGDGGGEGGGNE
jgi:hypothetical protein